VLEPSKSPFSCALKFKQENCAGARRPRDATAVLFGLKFDDNIHYKFKSSQASKAMLICWLFGKEATITDFIDFDSKIE